MKQFGVLLTALLLAACTADPAPEAKPPIDVNAGGYSAGDSGLRRLS